MDVTTGGIYSYSIDSVASVLNTYISDSDIVTDNKKIEYFNVPCSFDIETSSFFRSTGEGEKVAIMYEWTLGLNGAVIIGRTWDEFLECVGVVSDTLNLNKTKRLIVYVHNLGYEFQFFRRLFEWENIFSLRVRTPVYALCTQGIEFRSSDILSGMSLAMLGKNLVKYKVSKLVGDLDYSKLRHSLTPLTEQEIGYCVNDVRVVMAYIKELIEREGDITKLPLTNTGFVRSYFKTACIYGGCKSHKKKIPESAKSYRKLIKSLTLEPNEFEQLNRAFQGGFTHANAHYTGKVLNNVGSFDFTSSYPYVMLAEKFPMSKGVRIPDNEITEQEFEFRLNNYCCLFDIEFFGLVPKLHYDHPLSASRAFKKTNWIEDNGRIVTADYLITTITEQDYFTISEFYEWDSMKVSNLICYKRAYLPTPFIESMLDLYEKKTTLKDVEGQEELYLHSKGMLNSAYGMAVMNPVREEIVYNGEWGSSKPDLLESIETYNNSKTRFLFYPWGVWVTAYARRNLFSGIKAAAFNYVYSDTDSIKVINPECISEYIEQYNNEVVQKLKLAMEHHNLPFEKCCPKSKKGISKMIGVWDNEGVYSHFKTLGAKRYITCKKGKLSITMSGVKKITSIFYLIAKYGSDGIEGVIESFDDNLVIPERYTGKLTHTYIDEVREGAVTDYLGNRGNYNELSAVHLSGAEYSLSLSAKYIDYLKGITYYEN